MLRSVVMPVALTACGRLSFDALANNASDAAVVADVPAASCLPDPLATLVYATPGFADFQTTWSTGSNGTWNAGAEQLRQSDPASNFAYAYRDVGGANYRTVVTMHAQPNATAGGHATELALRVDGGNANMYQCNWEAMSGGLVINATQAGMGTNEFTRVTTDLVTIADPFDVTLEAQIIGSRIECCVVGIPTAFAAATDTRFATGAVGVKTFFVDAAFDHFAVFE